MSTTITTARRIASTAASKLRTQRLRASRPLLCDAVLEENTVKCWWYSTSPSFAVHRPLVSTADANLGRRSFGTSPKTPNNDQGKKNEPEEEIDESHLNWKDRKEAPKWMRRIAPSKGGKWPPSPQEAVILAGGVALFVWSWELI